MPNTNDSPRTPHDEETPFTIHPYYGVLSSPTHEDGNHIATSAPHNLHEPELEQGTYYGQPCPPEPIAPIHPYKSSPIPSSLRHEAYASFDQSKHKTESRRHHESSAWSGRILIFLRDAGPARTHALYLVWLVLCLIPPLMAFVLTWIGGSITTKASLYKKVPVWGMNGVALIMGFILGCACFVCAAIRVALRSGVGGTGSAARKMLACCRRRKAKKGGHLYEQDGGSEQRRRDGKDRVRLVLLWAIVLSGLFALPIALHAFRAPSGFRGDDGLLIIAVALGFFGLVVPVLECVLSLLPAFVRRYLQVPWGGALSLWSSIVEYI